MKKGFLHKNAAILGGLVLTAGSVMGLYFLGKSYSDNAKFDFVLQINRKNTMNYSRGTGDITRTALNFQEGLLSNSIKDPASEKLIDDVQAWGNEETRLKYKALTENGVVYQHDYADFDTVNRDDLSDGSTDAFEISGQGWGLANGVIVDKTNGSYRFFIRDDQKWSTGETVKPSDFGFSLLKIMNQRNASAAEYMPYKAGLLKGAQEWHDYQQGIITGDEKENWDDFYKLFHDAAPSDGLNIVTGKVNSGSLDDSAVSFNNEEGWVQYNTLGNPAFTSILQNASFTPINQDWFENKFALDYHNGGVKVGFDLAYFQMGYKETALSTYGAYNIDKFDPAYGVELSKNDNYWNKDAIINNNMNFRVITETSTQLSMFNSGAIQGFHPDEVADKTALTNDPNASKYIDWQLGNPTTRYANFNLDPTNDRPNAKFYKNANFRKAIFYALDRSHFVNFAGTDRSVPTSMITPTDFGTYETGHGRDSLANFGYGTELYEGMFSDEVYINGYTEEARKQIILTEQSEMNKVKYERGSLETESTNNGDAALNLEAAKHFFDQFKLDMASQGITVPETITIDYMTDKGDSDPVPSMLRTSLDDAKEIPVEIAIRTIPKGQTIATWRSGDFDLIEVGWNPDIGENWGALYVFNSVNRAKAYNLSAAWNYWTGSNETYGNTYGSTPTWEADGFEGLRTSNEIFNLIPDVVTSSNGVTLDGIHQFINDVHIYDPSTGGTPDENAPVSIALDNTPVTEDGVTYKQVNGTTQLEVFSMTEVDRARMYLVLEAIYQNGVPSIQFRNELPNGVPTLSPFSSVPTLGYVTQYYIYNPHGKLAKELGLPNMEAILAAREA